MSVIGADGREHEIYSLWENRKVVIAFTRHMGCRFCKEQVSMVEKIRATLIANDVTPIIITIGNYTDIPKFQSETHFFGEIYVDSHLDNPGSFELLKLSQGPDFLFLRGSTEIFREETNIAAERAKAFPDGGYGSGGSLFTGNILQVNISIPFYNTNLV